MLALNKWDSFYVIVGSGAAALIGLQFVVMTLVAERPGLRVAEAGAAFATPTIIHFSVALLVSALLRAPWETIGPPAILWGLTGFCGAIYTVIVARRMEKQSTYSPVFEDWLFHFILPLFAYALLTLSSFTAPDHTRQSLFCVGGSVLLLVFVGIHNTWDSVAYHVFFRRQEKAAKPLRDQGDEQE